MRLAVPLVLLMTASVVGCATATPTDPTPTPIDSPIRPPATSPTTTQTTPDLSPTPGSGRWIPAGPMADARIGIKPVLLADGSILAVGDGRECYPGGAPPGSERAEVFEPATATWVPVHSLNKPRKLAATTTLADGSAMVIGGINPDDVAYSSTKIFAPETRQWVDGPLLDIARGIPRAAPLADGRVLVASQVEGGSDGYSLSTTEIFDPRAWRWTPAASLSGPYLRNVVPLADGRILGTGTAYYESEPTQAAAVYEPEANAWTDLALPAGIWFELLPLPDGGALAIGGNDGGEVYGGIGSVTARVHRLDPGSETWREITSMPTARAGTASVVLDGGRVLVVGGQTGDQLDGRALATVEMLDLEAETWTELPALLEPRANGAIVLLSDGRAVMMGGHSDFNTHGDTPWCPAGLTSTEIWVPGS